MALGSQYSGSTAGGGEVTLGPRELKTPRSSEDLIEPIIGSGSRWAAVPGGQAGLADPRSNYEAASFGVVVPQRSRADFNSTTCTGLEM